MGKFSNPFSSISKEGKISKPELIRAIRFAISAEYDAIKTYTQLAETADSKFVSDVLNDIADEERVHVGEFMRVLDQLDPEEKKFYQKGTEEAEKIFNGQTSQDQDVS